MYSNNWNKREELKVRYVPTEMLWSLEKCLRLIIIIQASYVDENLIKSRRNISNSIL